MSSMFRRILFFAAVLSAAANAQMAAELKQQADEHKARGDAAGALELNETGGGRRSSLSGD